MGRAGGSAHHLEYQDQLEPLIVRHARHGIMHVTSGQTQCQTQCQQLKQATTWSNFSRTLDVERWRALVANEVKRVWCRRLAGRPMVYHYFCF